MFITDTTAEIMGSLAGESFVEEVCSASTGAEAVAVVQRAVEAPTVFFYGALLDAVRACAQKQSSPVQDDSLRDWIEVVELLSFKTVADVDACAAGIKDIVSKHPVIVEKLRILSLLTLCSQHNMTVNGIDLPYEAVAGAVGVKGSIEVQKVVLAAVQHKLCVARLNEKTATLRVRTYESRNVEADEVAMLKERIDAWISYTENQLRDIQ